MNSEREHATPGRAPSAERAAAEVEVFLAALDHAHRPVILAVREIIRGAAPGVGEGITWNAPSFHTSEHFATFHLRHRGGVQVVLHLGARPRPEAAAPDRVAGPAGLLVWRGPDRATVTFADAAEVEAKRAAFREVLRQWIALVE